MSSFSGPVENLNGLIFYYDSGNEYKSWKGKPTTNLLYTNITWAGDGSNQASFTKGQTEITDPDLMYKGSKTYLWAPGTSYNCYLQVSGDYPSTASTIWTFSCYVRREDRAPINSLNVYMYYPSSDGNAAGTIIDAGNGWYRISRTRTGTSNYLGLIGFTGFSAGYKYYLSGAMLTIDDHAVGLLDHNTTRSSTQSVLDMTGNNTVTISGLTYNSDGTLSFLNNSGFYIPTNDMSSEQTIEIWLQPLENDGARRNPYNQAYGGYGTWTHEPSGTINYYYGNAGTNGSPYTSLGSDVVSQNEIACMCVTRNTSTITWYKNGVATNSAGNPYGVLAATSANITIGNGYAGGYYGNIFSVKIYNRALSADQVLQNFYALKNQFGV